MSKVERYVGEMFTFEDGHSLQAVIADPGMCKKQVGRMTIFCRFYNSDCGEECDTLDRSVIGECNGKNRSDKTDVIFNDLGILSLKKR